MKEELVQISQFPSFVQHVADLLSEQAEEIEAMESYLSKLAL